MPPVSAAMELPSDDEGLDEQLLVQVQPPAGKRKRVPNPKPKPKPKPKPNPKPKANKPKANKPKAKPKLKPKPTPKLKVKGKSCLKAAADTLPDGLPPDDDGNLSLELLVLPQRPAAATKKSKATPRRNQDADPPPAGLPWDSDTLKAAAANIPSLTDMPFDDLRDLQAHPPQSWTTLQPLGNLQSTSFRTTDSRTRWNLQEVI